MRYPPHLLDDIRARLPVSQVVARKVALKKKGREFAGLSPFKVEKTPSFFVNDQKGFYHCFASGEHGDIFSFVMKTEGLSFPEAIERLAAEAGVPLPKPTKAEQGQDDRRQRLYALLETAAKFFETALAGSAGREARAYLDKRGVSGEAVRSFRLGYAPASRSSIRDHLMAAGYSSEEMAAAGMLITGEDIATPYDRFRHRVIFPITDLKNRIIAFGGRALDPNAPAKYLNSPETPLFHKGDNLYNAPAARSVAHQSGRLIVVEGYMDVVALSEAGFRESVAPLGTALTDAQIKLLWRMAPEPILFFDGDSAGRKAAHRAVDVVLPLLQAGHSVRFAFLSNGLDPDDLVRQQGATAVNAVLDKARPLFEVLWSRELELLPVGTPEQKASFEKRMKALVATISDPAVRHHYDLELRQRLWSWSRGASRSGPVAASQTGTRSTLGRGQGHASPGFDWRSRARGQADPRQMRTSRSNVPGQQHVASPELAGRTDPLPQREALIVQAVLNHPWLLDDAAEDFSAVEFSSPALARLRQDILSAYGLDNSLDSPGLRTHLNQLGVGKVLDLVDRSLTHKCDRFAEIDAERSEVETGWRHTLELHDRQVGLRRSLEAAERAWLEERSEEAYARICELQGLLHQFGEAGDDGSTAVSR